MFGFFDFVFGVEWASKKGVENSNVESCLEEKSRRFQFSAGAERQLPLPVVAESTLGTNCLQGACSIYVKRVNHLTDIHSVMVHIGLEKIHSLKAASRLASVTRVTFTPIC